MGVRQTFLSLKYSDLKQSLVQPGHQVTTLADLEIGKNWEAIHFLLTGETLQAPQSRYDTPQRPDTEQAILKTVIEGGQIIPDSEEITWLNHKEVSAIAQLLDSYTIAQWLESYNKDIFNQANVYPNKSNWEDDDDKSLSSCLLDLASFYTSASSKRLCILRYFST